MNRLKTFVEPAAILAMFLVDRWTKSWAMDTLAVEGPFEITPFFHLTYVENTGAAFGMLPQRNAFFIGLSAVLLTALFVYRRNLSAGQTWLKAGAALIIGGALGNLYDRIAYGYVVDFLDFLVWPVFNAADSFISVGLCCFVVGWLRARG